MWDLRNEKLRIVDLRDLETYFADPHGYQPDEGWKFSVYPDRD